MKFAIVGSRNYSDLDRVVEFVNALKPDDVVVSGGARGVDSVAEESARRRGLKVEIYLPNWERHGKKAGFLRNHQIVWACDELVAFWDGASRGTANSISIAKESGIPVTIFNQAVAAVAEV